MRYGPLLPPILVEEEAHPLRFGLLYSKPPDRQQEQGFQEDWRFHYGQVWDDRQSSWGVHQPDLWHKPVYWVHFQLFSSLTKEEEDVAEFLFHLFENKRTNQIRYFKDYGNYEDFEVLYKPSDIKKVCSSEAIGCPSSSTESRMIASRSSPLKEYLISPLLLLSLDQ